MEWRRPVTFFVWGLSMLSSCLLEYHFIEERKNWSSAQSYCREKYTDLATLHNMEDFEKVNQMILDNGKRGGAWIGLMKEDVRTSKQGNAKKWQWSLTDDDQYEEGERDYRNWHAVYPAEGRDCALMFRGSWYTITCLAQFRFVCLTGPGRGEYIKIDIPKSWPSAQSYCRQHHTDLASVRNQAENQKINELAQQGTVWIGLFRDSWKWSDGNDSSFRRWSPNYPVASSSERTCVRQVTETRGWTGHGCHVEYAFICYKAGREKHVLRLNLTSQDSSVHLNHAHVTEAMLKQVKESLRANGISRGVEVAWRIQPNGKVFNEQDQDLNHAEPACF